MKNWIGLFSVFSILIIISYGWPAGVLAYTEQTIGGNLIATVEPQFPGPREEVSVRLVSYGFETAAARFVWKLDGRIILEGLGQTQGAFRTGDPGKINTLHITALTASGATVEKILTFAPAGLDILWEGVTYTPPLYRGLSLPSPGSEIRVVALPNFINSAGRLIDPATLTYRWQKDGKNLPLETGVGKNILLTRAGNLFAGTKIGVAVATADGAIAAAKEITVPNFAPKIVFYQDRPLAGPIYSRSLGQGLSLAENETTIQATPFYFPWADYLDRRLNYRWSINGQPVADANQIKNPALLLERGDSVGNYRISLVVDNPNQVLQTASRSFTATIQPASSFSQPVSQNLFRRLLGAVNFPTIDTLENRAAVSSSASTLCPGQSDFVDCLPSIVNWLLKAAAFLAVLMFALGGVQYIWSGANPNTKSEAVTRMKAAVGGLILALASVLILQTINPDLVDTEKWKSFLK